MRGKYKKEKEEAEIKGREETHEREKKGRERRKKEKIGIEKIAGTGASSDDVSLIFSGPLEKRETDIALAYIHVDSASNIGSHLAFV